MLTHHQADLQRLFDARVPRYTSYPPANHFSATAGGENQAAWLASLSDDDAISLYVHIPFCRRLCWFCACRTQGTSNLRPVAAYVKDVLHEIGLVAARMTARPSLSRLHLGGGTPTILDASLAKTLLTGIFDAFDPGEDFEFSVEIDPTEASEAALRMLAEFGMNRASIGVQDFEPAVQSAIGREQSFAQTRRAVKILRKAGVRSLNVDLLYGLPHQTDETLARSLHKVLDLAPDRIALYGYAHVPWMSKRQSMIEAATLPQAQQRFELAEVARALLLQSGFTEVGIDHFARPGDGLALARDAGRLRRNFQGYTDDTAETLIGLGASAISRFAGGYCQNAAATSAYSRMVRADRLAGQRGFVLSSADRLAARMIEQLMCHFTLDTGGLEAEFPGARGDIASATRRLLDTWPDLCRYEAGRVVIARRGRPLIRVIAATLDRFVTPGMSHSLAV
ncbi:oxygen-independent coproporphyrinogen III oxidase [Sulfitobacter sp. D35]|uniref:oxygen-independent coproporphyrinogen III oxidase n=1 Tax=Sulfitobacter sp. D35 TaxID=3083252 RepID=UPI00296F1077|nr:oxygen-independent coproporphyrinogen III oxidase [Sulfitobacter sp. D35]MDW4498558.1 oxygen-independent coproporphyrinogen III oxidase [Sulfitobacter sp. D35]